MQRLSFRRLEVFRTVLSARTVSEAASRLRVTQPAVSKAIAQIEAELGLTLFGRHRGRLYPTEDAHRLYVETSRLFAQVSLFHDRVANVRAAQEGKARIAAIPTLAASLVARAAARLGAQRPRVTFETVSGSRDQVIHDVTHHRVDFGLVHTPLDDRTVVVEIIGASEIVAFVPSGHRLTTYECVTPKELDGEPIILLDSGSPPSHLVRETFAAAGAGMNIVMEVNNSAAAYASVVAGHGIALIDPWPHHSSAHGSPHTARFVPRIPLRIALVRSAFHPPSALATVLEREVREELRAIASENALVIAS